MRRRLRLQLIFKRYDKDKSCSISSFEMRNAVNDAGQRSFLSSSNVHIDVFLFIYLK